MNSAYVAIPGLQRTTSLRFVLRCARETWEVGRFASFHFHLCYTSAPRGFV